MINTSITHVDRLGDGITTVFSFSPLTIFAATDLKVYLVDGVNDADDGILLEQGSDAVTYSVSAPTLPGTGSITYPAVGGSPLPTGKFLRIIAAVPLLQDAGFEHQGGYQPKTVEYLFDKLVVRLKTIYELLNRALLVPRSSGFTPTEFLEDLIVGASGLPATITAAGGATSRSLADHFGDILSVKDFGAVGDGVTDDTAALAAAFSAIASTGKRMYIPAGIYVVSGSLAINAIGAVLVGDGPDAGGTVLKASGNFGQILELQAGSAEVFVESIRFDTTGTTTRCVTITRGLTPHFKDCGFKGNLTGALVYSTGDICQWSACNFQCDSANTIGLELDEHNQNCSVDSNTRFGGIGLGLKVSKSGSGPRVEGLKIDNVFFINTGAYNVQIGDSFFTSITGCPLDQASTWALRIHGGASKVQVNGGWFNGGTTGVGIRIEADAGDGHSIVNATCYGGASGINIAATASDKVQHVLIDGVMFDAQTDQAIALDSVTHCRIVNCIDRGTPTSGSWITSGTHATKGSYIFDNNAWHTTAPAAFDTASTYKWGNDTGIVMKNSGLQTGIAMGATTTVVAHGLSRTPTKILTTPLYATSTGAWFVHTIGATTFTIQWPTATPNANCTFAWQAEAA